MLEMPTSLHYPAEPTRADICIFNALKQSDSHLSSGEVGFVLCGTAFSSLSTGL